MEDFVENLGIPAEGPEAGDLPFRPESVFLLQPDGTADPFYQIGLIRLPALGGAEEPDPVPVILITRVQGKMLAAIPFSFWHRSVARRKLPPQSFSKAASVSVGSVLDVDREVPIEGTYIKIWIGFLSEELIQCLDFVSVQSAELENAFLTEQEVGEHVPLAEALQTVADEKFSFLSAESGRPDLGKSSQEKRIARVEEALVEMKALLHQFAQTKARPGDVQAAYSDSARESNSWAGPSCGAISPPGRSLSGAVGGAGTYADRKEARSSGCCSPLCFAEAGSLGCVGRKRRRRRGPHRARGGVEAERRGARKPHAIILAKAHQHSGAPHKPYREAAQSPRHFRRFSGPRGSILYFFQQRTRQTTCRCPSDFEEIMRDCPEELCGVLEKNTLHDCGAPELGPGLGIMTATFRGWAEHRSRVPNIQGTVRTLWAMWSSRLSMLFDRIALRRQRLG